MTKINILLADNDEIFLHICKEYLDCLGYNVLEASDPQSAIQILNNSVIHLAIIDLRLTNDDDENDRSGLLLAKKTAPSIPKLINTKFPSYQDAIEALRPDSDNLPSIVDFIEKQSGLDLLKNAIEDALKKYSKTNFDLNIIWSKPGYISFLHIILLINNRLEKKIILERSLEIEELFRTLFFDYSQITISRILWAKEARVAIEVFAFSTSKQEQFIITCGNVDDIYEEHIQYEKNVPNSINIPYVKKVDIKQTVHFGGIMWALIGEDITNNISLARFILENNEREIQKVINAVFHNTLEPWYRQGQFINEDINSSQAIKNLLISSSQEIPEKDVNDMLQKLVQEAMTSYNVNISFTSNQIEFIYCNHRFIYPNPIKFLYHGIPSSKLTNLSVFSPKYLDIDNILVDNKAQTCITDFYQIGKHHIYLNFISLETSIRFTLINSDNLLSIIDFEKQLLKLRSLKSKVQLTNVEPECKKALNAILTIRNNAEKLGGDNILDYYIWLFYYSTLDLLLYNPKIKHPKQIIFSFMHRLLFASQLSERISKTIMESENITYTENKNLTLDIDEQNMMVIVNNNEIELTSTEYKLFLYLYQHPGVLCKRSDILKEVYGYSSIDSEMEKNLINTPIYRLRQKIDLASHTHRFIKTIRGKGYRFDPYPSP